MKKILCKVRQNLFGFILGTIIFTTIGVYAATILASQVEYTNNDQENVQSAIDDLYSKTKKCSGSNCKCKRATTLHTEICNQENPSKFCSGAGYSSKSTIAYGQLGYSGTLTPGDAFDCDVDGKGNFQRFYYITISNGAAILIYYTNTSEGIANNRLVYMYNNSVNNIGPEIAKLQLPTAIQWPNMKLINNPRTILSENGNVSISSYNYSGYVARLLTSQEVNAACNIKTGKYNNGELDNCNYLMENTKFSDNELTYGYWLETPNSNYIKNVYYIDGSFRHVGTTDVSGLIYAGVRPVIEVPIIDIEI